jgi:PKD repeat protein
LLIAEGFFNFSTLQVISERGFSGNVTIDAGVPGCFSACPIAHVNQPTLTLTAGASAFTILNVTAPQGTAPGSYGIFVKAKGQSAGSIIINSTIVDVTVVSVGLDELPTAVISFSPLNPAPGQNVTFNSFGSSDPDGFILSYNWTFSDFTQVIVPGNTTRVQHTFAHEGSYNVILTVTDSSSLKGFAFVTVIVANQTDEPPFAEFFVLASNSTQPIRVGQTVTFDGSPSFDPDGFITSYSWNFGDGGLGSGPITGHIFSIAGNYAVRLTVTDSSGLVAQVTHIIPVVPGVLHDVGLVSVDPEPKTVISGQSIFIGLGLVNLGQQPENVDITVRFNNQVAIILHQVTIPMTSFPYFVQATWDTTGVAAGNYTISASVFLATDQNLANNQLTDGIVTILPPPVLSVSPSQGPVGTKVTVHGSGFPVSANQFQFPITVEVTFDDQFVGFETLDNTGSFIFVFNVPEAQATLHQIHAYAQIFPTQIEATANFTVVPGPSTMSLTVSVGSIYFPGDTAVIYVLSTLNGSPAQVGTVNLSILLPNGTRISLTLQSISTGVYKASFTVPSTNSLGTYGLVATAQQNGDTASGLGSFEVKQTWLASNSGKIITGTAVTGAIGTFGILAFAWRKGYLTKRKAELPF